MKIYGIGLLVLITFFVLFTIRFFITEAEPRSGVRAAIKIGLFLYPLGIGTTNLAFGYDLTPLILWRLYLAAAAAWLLWIMCAPVRFGTRKALTNQTLKENPIICWLLFGSTCLIFAPALVILSRHVY